MKAGNKQEVPCPIKVSLRYLCHFDPFLSTYVIRIIPGDNRDLVTHFLNIKLTNLNNLPFPYTPFILSSPF